MGTHVSINLWLDPGHSAAEAGEAMQAAFDEIARLETVMSEWQPTSEVSRLNAAAGGEALVVSPELFRVLERSVEVSRISDGAFDISFHGVGQLWSFKPGARPPSPEDIAAKLPLVGWRAIELDPATRKARLAKPGMMVGLGAIAKGYAVDQASELLRARGFVNHVVEGGGDTYVSGTKGGKPWMVGIQDPDRKGVIGALPSSDISVVTSGDYERFFEFEGKRYAHILDPRTGYPVEESKSCKSVTAVAPNATDADALTTAIAVMGPVEGMRFVERQADLEAILITRAGEVLISTGLLDRFIWAPEHDPARAASPPSKGAASHGSSNPGTDGKDAG